jgi:negative regulator of flagellin synthesis FlgM
MMIERIGGINPLDNLNNTQRTKSTARASQAPDVINVSEEALKKAEAYYLAEIANETSDVRAELIAQIKEKIKDPSYINAAIVDSAAERIMDAFGL